MKHSTLYDPTHTITLRVGFCPPHGVTYPSARWSEQEAADHIANILFREGTGVFMVEVMAVEESLL
jgi:hypothetical protein